MRERKINLEEIISKTYGCEDIYEFQRSFDISVSMIKEICINVCKQVLELASENVKMDNICDDCSGSNLDVVDGYVHCKDCDWMGYSPSRIVNKQSILDTINQVE